MCLRSSIEQSATLVREAYIQCAQRALIIGEEVLVVRIGGSDGGQLLLKHATLALHLTILGRMNFALFKFLNGCFVKLNFHTLPCLLHFLFLGVAQHTKWVLSCNLNIALLICW